MHDKDKFALTQCFLCPQETIYMIEDKTVYFGGSGFRCAFYIGCMKALQERWPGQYPKKIHADSAGSMIALGYALGVPWHRLEVIYKTCIRVQQKRSHLYFGEITKDHNYIIREIVRQAQRPLSKASLSVSVTHFPATNVTIPVHHDNVHHALLQSMFFPFIGRFQPVIDGALTTNGDVYDVVFLTDGTGGNGCNVVDISPTFPMYSSKASQLTLEDVDRYIDEGYRQTKRLQFGAPMPAKILGVVDYVIVGVVWCIAWLHYVATFFGLD